MRNFAKKFDRNILSGVILALKYTPSNKKSVHKNEISCLYSVKKSKNVRHEKQVYIASKKEVKVIKNSEYNDIFLLSLYNLKK